MPSSGLDHEGLTYGYQFEKLMGLRWWENPGFLGEEVRDKYTPLWGVTHEGSHSLGEVGEPGPPGIIPWRNGSIQGSRQKQTQRQREISWNTLRIFKPSRCTQTLEHTDKHK